MTKERAVDIWKRSSEIQISFAKKQNTSTISEISARLLTTEVLALSYLLRAAQDNGDHFQKQFQRHKQQSSEFRINPMEPSRLADERETAQKNRQMYRQKKKR